MQNRLDSIQRLHQCLRLEVTEPLLTANSGKPILDLKTSRPLLFLLSVTTCLLFPVGDALAERFSGRASIRGSLNRQLGFEILRFNSKGMFLTSPQGNQVNATVAFRAQRDAGDTSLGDYPGTLNRAVNKDQRVRRARSTETIQVRRRSIVFPGGRFKLSRPISPTREGRQRISGRGTLRIDA